MELLCEQTGDKITLQEPAPSIGLENSKVTLTNAPAVIGRGGAFGVEGIGQFALMAKNDETLTKVLRALSGVHQSLQPNLIDNILMTKQEYVKPDLGWISSKNKPSIPDGKREVTVLLDTNYGVGSGYYSTWSNCFQWHGGEDEGMENMDGVIFEVYGWQPMPKSSL